MTTTTNDELSSSIERANSKRVDDFFASNDAKFKDLIDQHRQFQKKQKRNLSRFHGGPQKRNGGVTTSCYIDQDKSIRINNLHIDKTNFERKLPKPKISSFSHEKRHHRSKAGLAANSIYTVTHEHYQKQNTDITQPMKDNTPDTIHLNPSIFEGKHLPESGSQVPYPSSQKCYFNNSFGIRALERRIDADSQLRVRRQHYLQRSASLNTDEQDSTSKTDLKYSSSLKENACSFWMRGQHKKPFIGIEEGQPRSTVKEVSHYDIPRKTATNQTKPEQTTVQNHCVTVKTQAASVNTPTRDCNYTLVNSETECIDAISEASDEPSSEAGFSATSRPPLIRQPKLSDHDEALEDAYIQIEEELGKEELEEIGEVDVLTELDWHSTKVKFSDTIIYISNSEESYVSDNETEEWCSKARRKRLKDTSWRKVVNGSQEAPTDLAATDKKDWLDAPLSPDASLATSSPISPFSPSIGSSPVSSSQSSSPWRYPSTDVSQELTETQKRKANFQKMDNHSITPGGECVTSADHCRSDEIKGNHSNGNHTSPNVAKGQKTESKKTKRVRRPYNQPRISSDSVDDVFCSSLSHDPHVTPTQPPTRRLATGSTSSGSSCNNRSVNKNHTMTLGSHFVTIMSPTSSEEDDVSVTDEDYMTSRKSSQSEPDEQKNRISTNYNEWLTDNEVCYENVLNLKLGKLSGDPDGEVSESLAEPCSPTDKGTGRIRQTQSFSETMCGTKHRLLCRAISLKKFSSEGDIHQMKTAGRNKEKVKLAITELFETEKRYTESLVTTLEVFSQPIKDLGLIPRKAHSILFPAQLVSLLYKHAVLVGRLEERLANWQSVQRIGDLFSVFEEDRTDGLFKIYLQYITHFPKLFEKLTKITESNERFRNYIHRCRREVAACNRLSLLSFLYSPIQRLPRYLLILRTYIKHIDSNHSDRDDVQSAVISLERLLFEANKSCHFIADGNGAIKLPRHPPVPPDSSEPSPMSDTEYVISDPESCSSPSITQNNAAKKKMNIKFSAVLNVLTFNSILKAKRRKKKVSSNGNEIPFL